MRRRRRSIAVLMLALIFAGFTSYRGLTTKPKPSSATTVTEGQTSPASVALAKLAIKGRAPKTGYSRDQFSSGWAVVAGCDIRERILRRDLKPVVVDPQNNCTVKSGTLDDPYTAKTINFARGAGTSSKVQIDHVVAVSDAWQKGAQQLTAAKRHDFYNDPLNLLAVDGPTNQKKGDGDAATWLPPNKEYRCRYVARQIAVKLKYLLWVTQAEHDAMSRVLSTCPGQALPLVTK